MSMTASNEASLLGHPDDMVNLVSPSTIEDELHADHADQTEMPDDAGRRPVVPAASLPGIVDDIEALVAEFAGRLDELADLPDVLLPDMWQTISRAGEQLAAIRTHLMGRVDASGVLVIEGHENATPWVSAHTRASRADCARHVRLAADLRRDYPETATAWLTGSITGTHAHLLVSGVRRALTKIPTHQRDTQRPAMEHALLNVARIGTVDELRRAIARLIAMIDPDGPPPPDDATYLRLTPVADGYDIRGWLTHDQGALLATALDARINTWHHTGELTTSNRDAGGNGDGSAPDHSSGSGSGSGMSDRGFNGGGSNDDERSDRERSRGERLPRRDHLTALALADLAQQWLDTGRVGTVHGERPHVTLLLTLDQARTALQQTGQQPGPWPRHQPGHGSGNGPDHPSDPQPGRQHGLWPAQPPEDPQSEQHEPTERQSDPHQPDPHQPDGQRTDNWGAPWPDQTCIDPGRPPARLWTDIDQRLEQLDHLPGNDSPDNEWSDNQWSDNHRPDHDSFGNQGTGPTRLPAIDPFAPQPPQPPRPRPAPSPHRLHAELRLPGHRETTPLHPSIAQRLTCDPNLRIAIVTNQHRDQHGTPLDPLTGQLINASRDLLYLGRAKRLADPTLRTAINLRDNGCTFPGCRAPSDWTEPHHVTHWTDGGTTDIDNLTSLCSRHHTIVHRDQWTITPNQRQAPTSPGYFTYHRPNHPPLAATA